MKKYNWPLSESNFTWMDRLKICKFFLDPSRQWTEGAEVRKFQEIWAEYTGSKYCVMTSSGSTANTLIAQYIRDQFTNKEAGANIIVTQPVGWMTSYSPFLREGFDLKFIDVTMDNLSMDLDKLEKYLKKNWREVAAVFVVSILGFAPDMERLLYLQDNYNVKIYLDGCESSGSFWKGKSILSYFTSSTSLYFSHLISTGTEGGLIFTNSKEEFEYYLLAHHNGLVRFLEPYMTMKTIEGNGINELSGDEIKNKANPELKDSRFDFYQLGNNYRSSDISAFIGQLDFARRAEYYEKRINLYYDFIDKLNNEKYQLVVPQVEDVPFAIPVIIKGDSKKEKTARLDKAFKVCNSLGIEYRSLVSGNILRQRAFEGLDNPSKFKVADELHNFAFYVGLNPKLNRDKIFEFVKELNKI